MKKFNNLLLEFFKLPSKDNTQLLQGSSKVFTSYGTESGGNPSIHTSYHAPIKDREGKQQNLWVSVIHHPKGAGGDVKFPHSEIHFDLSHVTPSMFWKARTAQLPVESINDAYYKAFIENNPNTNKRHPRDTTSYNDYVMNTSNQFKGLETKKVGSLSTPRWLNHMVNILWHHVENNPNEGRDFVAGAGGIDETAQREKHVMYGRLMKVMENKNFIKTHGKRYASSKFQFPLMHHFSVL